MHRDLARLVDRREPGGGARFHQAARDFGLTIDRDRLTVVVRAEVDAPALALPEHLEAVVDQAFPVHAVADADLVQQLGRHLFEHTGADAAEHVLAALALHSAITASIPALCSSCPSSRPDGPAPMMATWVLMSCPGSRYSTAILRSRISDDSSLVSLPIAARNAATSCAIGSTPSSAKRCLTSGNACRASTSRASASPSRIPARLYFSSLTHCITYVIEARLRPPCRRSPVQQEIVRAWPA